MVSTVKDTLLEPSVKTSLEGQNKETPNFICPICGSKEFIEKYKSNGILGPGGRSRRVHCVCAGCSVMFVDPEKFSRNRA